MPGDPSQAAFWVVAGCVVPGQRRCVVENVYAGPARIGFIERARSGWGPRSASGGSTRRARVDGHGPSRPAAGTVVEAAEIPSLDEVPVLAVAAAVAEGDDRVP